MSNLREVKSYPSPLQSQFSIKTFTEMENKLANEISKYITRDPVLKNVIMTLNEGIPRGEYNKEGFEKHYCPDIALKDLHTEFKYAIECMGEGSKSDDDKRTSFLIGDGYHILFFTNEQVKHSAELCMTKIVERIRMMRLLWK